MAAARFRLGPGSTVSNVTRAVLAVLVAIVSLDSVIRLVATTPVAIDLLIPLQASERWLDGGIVYIPDGFTDPQALPPFLYPPFVLPFLAPLTAMPEEGLRWFWVAATLVIGWWAYRGLGLGAVLAAIGLLWIPMAEGVWTGNIAVWLFAAFVGAFWQRSVDGRAVTPVDLSDPMRADPRAGFLAASLAAVNPSQVHAWLVILRRRRRSAVIGLIPWVAVVLFTLPIVGIGAYLDWFAQVRRAADPAWPMMGVSLLAYLPAAIFAAFTVASLILAWRLRGPELGAWIGILMFVVTPNMHSFNGLFLLPGLLLIRREFALLAAMLMSTYTAEGWWLGAVIVIGFLAGGVRWPALREPQDAVVLSD